MGILLYTVLMRKKIFTVAAVCVLLLFVLNTAAYFYGWYDSVRHFDKAMHVLGGAAVALFFLAMTKRTRSIAGAIMVVLVIGLAWEAYEFIVQSYTGVLLATIPDSTTDVIADLLGGIAAGIFVSLLQTKYNRKKHATT